MDVDLLRPGTVPISRDTFLWFDFLLDPSRGGLLENHLDKPNPDPSGIDLIIKFLVIPEHSKEPADAAAAVGPVAPDAAAGGGNGSGATEPGAAKAPPEKPTLTKLNNKHLSLKILALKIFAFYKWDLDLIEQKLHMPLQMMLLCDLMMLANVGSKSAAAHLAIDYTAEPDHVLFAVSLYHRWALRAVIGANHPAKQARYNGMHNIPETQYIVLCVADEMVSRLEEDAERSVEVISKIVEAGNTRGACQMVPSSATFVPLSEDDAELNVRWAETSDVISVNEFHCQLLFDVSVYQFYRESYAAASQNFDMCHSRYTEWRAERPAAANAEGFYCRVRGDVLDGYVAASRPLLLRSPSLTLTQRFLVSCRDNYTKLLEILEEDNVRREIPQAYRDCLELELAAGLSSGTLTATRDLLIRIQTLNVIRRVLDSGVTNYNFASKLSQARKAYEIFVWALQQSSRLSEEDQSKLRSFMHDIVLSCDESLAADICSAAKLQHLVSDELRDHVLRSSSAGPTAMDTSDSYDPQLSALRDIQNPQLEVYTVERQLLKTNDPPTVKELVCVIASANSGSSMRSPTHLISRLDPKWEIPGPLQSALMSLNTGLHQQFLYIMLAKAKALERDRAWRDARRLLAVVADEVKMCSGSANVLYRLRQLVDWETLLLDINQFHATWPAQGVDRRELGARCQMMVQSSGGDDGKHGGMPPRAELLEAASVALLNLADWESVTAGLFLDKRLPACQLVSAIGFACQDIVKFKGNKKVSRDAWDLVLPTFLNQGGSGNKRMMGDRDRMLGSGSQSSSSALTVQVVSKVLLGLRDLNALTVAISLLARIHNVLRDDQYSLELITEHTALWPGVVSNTNCYNMRAVTELLSQMLTQAVAIYPTSVAWLKLFGDLYFVMQHYSASLKYYTMAAIQNSDYFTKPLALEDHVYKRMMKCCTQLQCFAQAGILCQFTEEVDYNSAFKALSEQVSWDAMDSYYDCIWDVNILEYLIQMHHKRGEVYRKQKAIRLIGLLELNANNNEEIKREAANIRKSRFMRSLANQYVGLCALSNARQFSITAAAAKGKGGDRA